MTRDEAMRLIQMNRIIGASPEMQFLSWVEGLGLLKFDEPKGADERLALALGRTFSFDTNPKEMGLFRDQLTALGLQITEKQETP